MRNFIITVNGNRYEVSVEETGAASPASPASPKPNAVPLAAKETAPAPQPAGGTNLVSPFPGLVKSLLVENGAKVKKDQAVLVLEALKMDNDITAPCDGTITFRVQKGSNVESESVLAVIS